MLDAVFFFGALGIVEAFQSTHEISSYSSNAFELNAGANEAGGLLFGLHFAYLHSDDSSTAAAACKASSNAEDIGTFRKEEKPRAGGNRSRCCMGLMSAIIHFCHRTTAPPFRKSPLVLQKRRRGVTVFLLLRSSVLFTP